MADTDTQQFQGSAEKPPPYIQPQPQNQQNQQPPQPTIFVQPNQMPGYYPAPYGVAPAPYQPFGAPTFVAASGAQIVVLTENPTTTECPHCRTTIVTRTQYVNGMITWIFVLMLTLMGCILGCCLIPLYIDALKDVEHYCLNCNALIGTYRRVGQPYYRSRYY